MNATGPGTGTRQSTMRIGMQPLRMLFALGLALILGCGGGSDTDGTGGSGDAADTDGEVEELVITLWEQMDPQEREIQKQHIEALEQSHPGLKFEISHYVTEQLRTQFQTAALAGSGPDLV